MSDSPFPSDANPYQSPQTTTLSGDNLDADPSLAGAADMLRQTKPWVRFMSVMLFIGAGLMAIGGLAIMAIGMGQGGPGAPGMPGAFGPILGAVYIVMALLYIVPGIFLWKYADRIGAFLYQQTPAMLTSALEPQKSFWRFTGIVTLILISVYFLIIVLAAFGAIVGATM